MYYIISMKKSRKIIGEEVKKLSINSPLIDMIFAIVIRLITKENYLKIEINFLHLFFVCVLFILWDFLQWFNLSTCRQCQRYNR